jgi:cell division protease FtsH
MKFSKEDKKEFFRRKDVLEKARVELKKEFSGLDSIIDEVIHLIEPWYLFPSGQIRPTVINLWGMTGVGKTSLIKSLFNHLQLDDSLYKFDVGDYASQDNTKLSYSFSEKLKNREKHQIGIIFDEFQLGRTINENGEELDKSGLRAMWDLLDSGKISILQSSYYGSRVFQLTIKLEDCIQNGNVEAKSGIITQNKNYHDKFFQEDESDDKPKGLKVEAKKEEDSESQEDLFVTEEFFWCIQSIWDTRFITERELKEHLKTMDHNQTIDFLNETMLKAFKPQEFDYSTSCIFVIGNIDEAYKMANSFDPDSDADRFYKHSLKITLPQIKASLKRRFRAEQIARLGNSHVIYPAFSSKVYKELIELELSKSRAKVKDRFSINLNFHPSINTIIYKEGVFPTQGARPVFTTITSLVESYVGKIAKDIIESGLKVKTINWKFSRGKHKVDFIDKKGDVVMRKSYDVKLKVESLRQSDNSEMQASVAIHEAGHAVAAIYGANIMPTEIVSRTANLSEGHCAIELPALTTKELMEKDILISLGGYCAEKMIFGDENLGIGTGADFERATATALEMAKTYGMVDTPMWFGHKSANTNSVWNSNTDRVNELDKKAEDIINTAYAACMKMLDNNRYLLLKIGEYLSTNSKMDYKKVKKFVEEYGKPVDIKKKENYHRFKEMIAEQLNQESNGAFGPRRGISERYGKTIIVESKEKNND